MREIKFRIWDKDNNLASWYMCPLHTNGWHGITRGDMALMCEVIGNIYDNPELLKEMKNEGAISR